MTDNQRNENLLIAVGLLAIMVLAAYLRFVGLDWDHNHHLHPDERFLTQVTSAMHSVDSLEDYFDTNNSTLNPNNVGYAFFVYGDFPIILTRYIAERVDQTSYYTIYLVGRVISAISDLLSVLVIFLVGKKLFNARVGLLSAAFYGFAALPIQQAHFFTVEAITNLFVVVSFLFIARTLTKHNWLDYPLFGLSLGLAMSSKVSVFPLALLLIVALVLRVAREINQKQEEHIDKIVQNIRASQEVDEPLSWIKRPTTRLVGRAAIGLVIAGLVTVAVFRVGQPYAFLPPNSDEPISVDELGLPLTVLSQIGDPIGLRPNPSWLLQMDEVRRQVSGYADIPPNHQWGKRIPLVFPWVNMVRVGLGWPLGIFCWLAFAWALWEIGRGQRGASALMLPVTWTALIFVWQGIGWVKTMRYFLPIYPLLLMLGAWAAVTIWDRIQGLLAEREAPRWHWAAVLSAGLTGLVVASAFIWGFSVSRIYTRPVTRVEASEWMLENIPSDVTLSFETDEGPRLFQLGLPNNWPSRETAEASVTEPTVKNTFIGQGLGQAYPFTLSEGGILTEITLNHVLDAEEREEVETLDIVLTKDYAGNEVLATGSITSDFNGENNPRGDSYTIKIDPVILNADETYYLFIKPVGPMLLSASSLAVEGSWDDPLPLSIAPYNVWGAQYQGYELEMSWEDTDEKRDRINYILDQTDYIAISSNRFYAAMARNPQRYPLTIRYYEALFSGELGFELVGDFTSRPNFGPIEFNDDSAEEAWTVYDHPHVLVFQKTDNYDPVQTAEILGDINLDNVVRLIAKDSKGRPVKIPLPRLRSKTGMNLVNSNSASSIQGNNIFMRFQPLAVLAWWLLVLGIGVVAFPSLFALFHALPDRAYPISRAFGLLFVAWLSWFAGSYSIPWGGFSVAAAIVVLGLLSLAFIWPRRVEFTDWLREHWRHILLIEGVFAVLFLLFVLIRMGNPDLWHPAYGGEKPMDMAYFNAILNSESFPPYDPWFAGGTINYYYFGFVVVGAPLKLLPIPMTLAYNLILPTLFAITGLGAFSVAYNLVSPWEDDPSPEKDELPARPSPTFWQTIRTWPKISVGEVVEALGRDFEYLNSKLAGNWKPYAAGAAALLLTVILGNLDQMRTVIWGFAELGSGEPAFSSTLAPNLGDVFRGIAIHFSEGKLLPVGLGEWYWNATRLIPVPIDDTGNIMEVGPITEFPFFTFLYADLHAHMIAMPVGLLALTWATAQIRSAFSEKPLQGMVWLNVISGALIIGALRAINTWDMPAYLVLGAAALALAHFYRRQAKEALPALVIGALTAAIMAIFAYFFVVNPDNTAGESSNFNLLAAGIAAGVGLLVGFAAGLVAFQPAKSNEDHDNLYYWATLGGVLLQVAVMAGGTVLFFLPYIQNYNLGYTSFIPWTGSKTPLWAYLDILGLFFYLIISWMVYESIRWGREGRLERSSILPLIIGLGALGGLIWLAATEGYPVALVVLPLTVWAAALFLRPDQTTAKRVVLGMVITALALSLMVEVVVLQGDISRMNTVFKFYLQVWILMAISAAAALGWLWPVIRRQSRAIRAPWGIILGVLVFLSVLYPLLATRAKIADRWNPDAPSTLDGMAYMPYVERYENGEVFSLKPDYEALRWLQENINGTPVVLEAHTVEYQWGSRVSIYTGLPSVIGWNWHQRQQRPTDSTEVWVRVNAVESAYNSTDIDETLRILDRYNVELIMVGELERIYYDAVGLEKFEEMAEQGYLERIYEKDGTLIYQVVRS